MAKKPKKIKVPGAYLSGVSGRKRDELRRTIQKISRLYKAGKRVPKTLLDKRIKLGTKKKK